MKIETKELSHIKSSKVDQLIYWLFNSAAI
jgi:hypothetical protein